MKLTVFPPLDGYQLKKAINANATTMAAGGVDAMMAYAAATNSPGSNAVQAIGAASAPPGGDLETLALVPWLQDAVGNGGVGLSAASSPTLASILAALRASAQSF